MEDRQINLQQIEGQQIEGHRRSPGWDRRSYSAGTLLVLVRITNPYGVGELLPLSFAARLFEQPRPRAAADGP
jgi:hypothetical protein